MKPWALRYFWTLFLAPKLVLVGFDGFCQRGMERVEYVYFSRGWKMDPPGETKVQWKKIEDEDLQYDEEWERKMQVLSLREEENESSCGKQCAYKTKGFSSWQHGKDFWAKK